MVCFRAQLRTCIKTHNLIANEILRLAEEYIYVNHLKRLMTNMNETVETIKTLVMAGRLGKRDNLILDAHRDYFGLLLMIFSIF